MKYIIITMLLLQSCSHLPRSATTEIEKGTSKVELKNILIYEYPNYFTISADLVGASRHVASNNSKGKITIKIFNQDKKILLYEEEKYFSSKSNVKNSKKRFHAKIQFNPKNKHLVFRVDNY